MITIDYRFEEETHELSIRGHAGYSHYGNDIVCAGVSAIGYTLLGMLENNSDHIDRLDTIENVGDMSIFCEGDEKIATAFEMAIIGLAQIANQYPNNITLNYTAIGGDSRE